MNKLPTDPDYNSEYVDKLLDHLRQPDTIPGEKKSTVKKVIQSVGGFFSSLKRAAVSIATTGTVYNEAKARALVCDYINKKECSQALKQCHQKIVQIYERLAHISHKQGTWADGIDQELLFALAPDSDEDSSEKELDNLVLQDIFLPPSPKEQVIDALEPKKAEKVFDPKGKDYVFTPAVGVKAADSRMLFHIHADEFGKSSKLEGSKSKIAVEYLLKYLQAKGQNRELIEQLEGALDIRNDYVPQEPKKAQEKIQQAFALQKPLLVVGGWTANPSGHAIYYEIIPTSDQKANFRLYNTGAGVEWHASQKVGAKTKFATYTEWQGIERKRLESPNFLEALHEQQTCETCPNSQDKTQFSAKDIYQGLKALLRPEREKQGPAASPDHLMSPQRSGICAWKSLMAFLRTKMPLGDYKRLKCDMRLQSLADFVQNPSSDAYDSPRYNYTLVKKAYQNLCRTILHLHKNGLVGDQYILSAKPALASIAAYCKTHAKDRFQNRTYAMKDGCPYDEIALRDTPRLDTIDAEKTERTLLQKNSFAIDAFHKLETQDPQKIAEALETAVALASKAWKEQEDLCLYQGLLSTVLNLSMDPEFWKNAIQKDSKKADALIEKLGSLAALFTKSCFTSYHSEVIFSEKIYLFHKVLHLQECIMDLAYHKSPIAKLSLEANYFLLNTFFVLPNEKMNRELAAMKERQRKNNQVQIGSILSRSGPSTTHTSVGPSPFADTLSLNFHNGDSITSLAGLIREAYPGTIALIAKDDPSFNKRPKFSQDAHIYTSSLLPPFIKSMRDTYLYASHLKMCRVGPIPMLQRATALTHEFHVKDKDDASEITISLSGIDRSIPELPASRYASQFPAPSTDLMKELFSYIDKEHEEREIAFYETKKEEFKEIARLFTHKKTNVIETIAYFTRHPEKLKERDFQTLLQISFFKVGTSIASRAKPVSDFIERHYEFYKDQGEIQTVVFLLKIAHQLRPFCPQTLFFQKTEETLKKLLLQKDLDVDERCVIYSELVQQLGQKSELSDDEVELLVIGSIFFQENQGQCKQKPAPKEQMSVELALHTHAATIKKMLNPASLNRIVRSLRAEKREDLSWEVKEREGEFPCFAAKDSTHVLYPLAASLVSSVSIQLLPMKIRSHPFFTQLFTGIQQATLIGPNVYSFKDAYNVETRVSLDGDYLNIEQKRGKLWCRFIPSSAFCTGYGGSHLQSYYLLNRYTHWEELGKQPKKIHVVSKKTNREKYYIYFEKDKNLPQKVERIKDGAKLDLSKEHNLPTCIETPQYVHKWLNAQNSLVEIELARYDLHFKPDPQTPDKLLSIEFPGYFLNVKENVQELGWYKHYILLENSSGAKKVLLPHNGFEEIKFQPEVLLPNYQFDQQGSLHDLGDQKYYTFDLQSGGRLANRSREANLHLAQVTGVVQEYKKAAFYLKKFGNKLSSYTEKEKKILTGITESASYTGDMSGNAVALRLYADYLLLHNALANGQQVDSEQIKAMWGHYSLYLTLYGNITALKLSKQEELFILKILLDIKFSPLFYLRLKELDPVYAKNLRLINTPEEEKEAVETVRDIWVPSPHYQAVNGTNAILLTRFSSANFQRSYEQARAGSFEEKSRIEAQIDYALAISDETDDNGIHLLRAVLHNPDGFPPWPDLTQDVSERRKQSNEWEQKVRTEAKVILAKLDKPIAFSYPQLQESAIQNNNFCLDEASSSGRFVDVHLATLPESDFADECLAKKCFQVSDLLVAKDTSGLSQLLQTCNIKDPVEKNEIERLEADLSAYQKQPAPPKYTSLPQKLIDIEAILSKDEEQDASTLDDLTKSMLELANKSSIDRAVSKDIRMLERKGEGLKVITLDELIVYFARKNTQELSKRNPALSDSDIAKLMQQTGHYVAVATRDQQRKRAYALL